MASQFFVSRIIDFLSIRLQQSNLFTKAGVSPLVDIRSKHEEIGNQYGDIHDFLVLLQEDCQEKVEKQVIFSDLL